MTHETVLNSHFGVPNGVLLEHSHAHSIAQLTSCNIDYKIFIVCPFIETVCYCHHFDYFMSSS